MCGGPVMLINVRATQLKDTKTVLDLLLGEYICQRFAETTFCGLSRTVIFQLLVNEDGQPRTEVEMPVYGHLLKKEIGRLGDTEMLQEKACPIAISPWCSMDDST